LAFDLTFQASGWPAMFKGREQFRKLGVGLGILRPPRSSIGLPPTVAGPLPIATASGGVVAIG